MFLVPKGIPVFKNLAVSKLKLPDVLTKLSNGVLTGYASFVFESNTAILVFEAGKLVSVLVGRENGKWESGVEALSTLVELIVTTGSGSLNVYKLSRNLAMSIHSLLEGETPYNVQALKRIDIKSLPEIAKEDQTNGCLRIYADKHSVMIFYRDGTLGFFHNDSIDIETSLSELHKIEGLSGSIDMFAVKSGGELIMADLLEVTDIKKTWDSCIVLHKPGTDKLDHELNDQDEKVKSSKFAKLEEQVKSIVSEYAGKVGRGIVDKEISDNGGNLYLVIADGKENFMKNIERKAKFLVSGSNIKLMMEKLSSIISSANAEQ